MVKEYNEEVVEEEEDEEIYEEEESEEEEIEEWLELIELDEIDGLEDGPSTFFVGGFSVCNKLSTAVESVQYKEDRIRVFPGVFGGPDARSPADRDDVIELDEYRLAGLHIEGVPFAMGAKRGYPVRERFPNIGRRVGPWYIYLAAAATKLEEKSGKTLLESSKNTTSMASSVYGKTFTPTEVDPQSFPVLHTRLVLKYDLRTEAEKEQDEIKPLKHYQQEADEDEDDEEAEEPNEDPEEVEEENEGAEKRAAPSMCIQGLCFLYGLVVEPLTRALVQHCVFGVHTSVLKQFPIQDGSTVEAKALCEVRLENCIIYGSRKTGIYAFPRSSLSIRHSIIDGPGTSESLIETAKKLRSVRHLSSLAVLEYRARFRAGLVMNASNKGAGGSGESDSLANFIIPDTVVCDVGVFCDDADINVQDCIISNTRLGVCLHDSCERAELRAIDIRSCQEVGLYFFGTSGCARVSQSYVSACGRECLLIKGLHPTETQKALEAYKIEHNIQNLTAEEEAENEEEPEDEENDAAGPQPRLKTNHPLFAQHPCVKNCSFIGGVRVQGDVRLGAVGDNFVYRPSKEGPLSVAAVGDLGDEDLIVAPSIGAEEPCSMRGFKYCGVEGMKKVRQETDE